MKNRIIDASGKSMGRVATEVAKYLQGKAMVDFARNSDAGDSVTVLNIKDVKITGKKLTDKQYYSYSGYPGGLTSKTMGALFEKNPAEVLRKTVWNMLPKNTHRKQQILRLIVK